MLMDKSSYLQESVASTSPSPARERLAKTSPFWYIKSQVSLKILVYCLCFKPASRCLLFSKVNSRHENRSKLSFTARIINKYFLERFISICGEKMSKGFLKFYKLIIKPDTRSDRCLKSYKRA